MSIKMFCYNPALTSEDGGIKLKEKALFGRYLAKGKKTAVFIKVKLASF